MVSNHLPQFCRLLAHLSPRSLIWRCPRHYLELQDTIWRLNLNVTTPRLWKHRFKFRNFSPQMLCMFAWTFTLTHNSNNPSK